MAERPFPAEPTAKERAMMERMKREREQQKAQDRAYSEAMPVVDEQTQPYKRGGKIAEHKGEHYASKAMKRQHEKTESPAKERMEEKGMNCGGKVKKYASGGNVRGGGIAQRGVGRGRMC